MPYGMDEQTFKDKLTPEQYRVMRQKGTEAAFSGKYWASKKEGEYACAACGNPLFSSDEKFDAKTGWPSFHKPIGEKSVELVQEPGPDGRTEVSCKKCGSHLGYIIPGKKNHYRINSLALEFGEKEESALGELLEELSDEVEDELETQLEESKNDEGKGNGNEDQKKSPGGGLKPIFKNILVFVSGTVLGAVVGASASLLCQAPTVGQAPTNVPAVNASGAAPVALPQTPVPPAKTLPILPKATTTGAILPAPAGGPRPKPSSTTQSPASTSAVMAQPTAGTTTSANQTSSSAMSPSGTP